ncbi:hypothetical protein BV378_08630 [Nostoc sp. RF31YmG]|nr:hypothetical protein BV378_08630 [Nostoc sp. RF31YmG]
MRLRAEVAPTVSKTLAGSGTAVNFTSSRYAPRLLEALSYIFTKQMMQLCLSQLHHLQKSATLPELV